MVNQLYKKIYNFEAVSKLVAIVLSAIILFQSLNIGVDDFAQLDDFIEHAQFHKQEYGDNFFAFLSKHYGELKAQHNKEHHEEQEEHEKLPFQCQGHYVSILAIVQSTFQPTINAVEITTTSEANFHYLNLYASLNDKKLLQPPKLA